MTEEVQEVQEVQDEVEGVEPLNEIEQEAYAKNWRPDPERAEALGIEGYKGDPIHITTAEHYLERTKKERKLEEELAEQRQSIKEMREWALRQKDEGKKEALAEIKAQKKDAAIEGDMKKYDALEEKEAELLQPEKQPENRWATPEGDRAFKMFVLDHPQYGRSDILQTAMMFSNGLETADPNLTFDEHLEKVNEKVMAAHPEHFGVKKPVSPVETGHRGTPPKQSLPAEARKQRDAWATRMVKSGIFKDEKTARAEWEKGYEE